MFTRIAFRYLVLDMDGQTVDVEPFMRYVENMIEELSKGYWQAKQ